MLCTKYGTTCENSVHTVQENVAKCFAIALQTLRLFYHYTEATSLASTRRFRENPVLYMQLADNKLEVNCERNVKKIVLLLVKRCFIFTHYYSHNVYSEKSKFKFRS
jgi:hypothetical protein